MNFGSLSIVCLSASAAVMLLAPRAFAQAPATPPPASAEAPGPIAVAAEKGPPPVPPEAVAKAGGGPPNIGIGPLQLGLSTRVDVALGGDDLDDPYSGGIFQLNAHGKIHEYFSLTTRVIGGYDARDPSGAVSLLDAIVQFEPAHAFNLWLGRMLVPADRSALSGPWFMAPWYFTGLGYADGQVALPRAGAYGRSEGATVWGHFAGGHLKYYASALDLTNPAESPLFTGRINLALFNPEPSYYNSSTFYGKDMLALGVAAQYKKDGSADPMAQISDDYSEYNVDLLFEKDLGAAGVIDIEGAYYKFNGDAERTSESWLGLVSYVLPGEIAGVRLQPLVRVQQAIPTADGAPTSTLIDAQVAFLMKAHFARVLLGYRRGTAGPAEIQSVFLGFQFIRM